MNIPNILTIIRFFLIPAFYIVYFSSLSNSFIIAIFIFIVAGITDVLDGFIARKYNMITKWGTVLDPLADKLMIIMVLFCLSYDKIIPIWIFILILSKELLMILGGILLFKNKTVIAAKYYGKAATVLFYISVGVMMFNKKAGIYVIYTAIIVTIFAFFNYLRKYISIKKI